LPESVSKCNVYNWDDVNLNNRSKLEWILVLNMVSRNFLQMPYYEVYVIFIFKKKKRFDILLYIIIYLIG
jgi:hypothetical protein